MKRLDRVLWVLDYFPRPHDRTTGVWALETIAAIRQRGVEVVVLSPTPWIPPWLALTSALTSWSAVPHLWHTGGVPVFFPKCLHYPHRYVTRYLYHHAPFFDSTLVWKWCERTVAQIMERYPFQVMHGNFVFPGGFIGNEIRKRYGLPLVVHERSPQRLEAALSHKRRSALYSQVVREADAVITPSR